MTLSDLVRVAYANAQAKGWHDQERQMPELLCLVHSEVSETMEAYRDPTHEAVEEWTGPDGKPEGVPSELADILIRIADMCGLYGIDLEGAVMRKLAYNATRPIRHNGKRA